MKILKLISSLAFAGTMLLQASCDSDGSHASELRTEESFFSDPALRRYPIASVSLRRMTDQPLTDEAMLTAHAMHDCELRPCYIGLTHPNGQHLLDVLRTLCTADLPFPAREADLGIYVDSKFVPRVERLIEECPRLRAGPTFEGTATPVAVHGGAIDVEPIVQMPATYRDAL